MCRPGAYAAIVIPFERLEYPMHYETLTLSFTESLAEIRLSRPELLNRFDMIAHLEFVRALEEVSNSIPATRALVLSAEGRAFSAGGDFQEMLDANASRAIRSDMVKYAKLVFTGVSELQIPVVSAIQGPAIGLGATISTLCDIVVAWKGAKIADTHVNVGLVAGDGGIISWSQSVGVNRAKRYLLTGDIITGQQAYEWGLVTELVDNPEEAAPRARELATRIAALAPAGVSGTKRTFSRVTALFAQQALAVGLDYEMEAMASAELRETVEKLRSQ